MVSVTKMSLWDWTLHRSWTIKMFPFFPCLTFILGIPVMPNAFLCPTCDISQQLFYLRLSTTNCRARMYISSASDVYLAFLLQLQPYNWFFDAYIFSLMTEDTFEIPFAVPTRNSVNILQSSPQRLEQEMAWITCFLSLLGFLARRLSVPQMC